MRILQIRKKIPLTFAVPMALAATMLIGCGRREQQFPPLLHVAREAARHEDWNTAKDHLLDAADEFPDSLTVQMNLAMVQWRAGNLNDAIASFNRMVNREDVPPIVWEHYAQLQLEAGNPQATHELLENVAPPSPRALTLSAMADIKMESYERAKFALEHAIELDESYAPAWFHLARLYQDHLVNKVEAQIAFRNFKSHAPEEDRNRLSGTAFSVQTLPAPVRAPEDTTEHPLADPETTTAEIREQIRKAQQLTEEGEADTALLLLREMVEKHPNHPDAVWALARFYDTELELRNRADGFYNTFGQLFPRDPRVNQIPERARASEARQRPTGDNAVRQALLFQQGIEHYNRQEWDAAITAFRRVLSLAPDDAGAAFNLGLAYHKTDDLEAAATAFQQALEHEPDMIKSLYMLGLTKRDQRNIPEALQLLNRVIRLQPDFAKAHQVLGKIYLREGRPDMTQIHFQRILEIDPQTDEARKAQEWLEKQEDS